MLVTKTEEKTKVYLPKLYNVILHNDDETAMDFVVSILVEIFNKPLDNAVSLMLTIHNEGAAVCGTYTKEIATTKKDQVIKSARSAGYPLKCTIEKENI